MTRHIWWWFTTLRPGTRVAVMIAGFITLSVWAVPVAQAIAEIAQGLAVLTLAAFGFWLIATAPFRRRW